MLTLGHSSHGQVNGRFGCTPPACPLSSMSSRISIDFAGVVFTGGGARVMRTVSEKFSILARLHTYYCYCSTGVRKVL